MEAVTIFLLVTLITLAALLYSKHRFKLDCFKDSGIPYVPYDGFFSNTFNVPFKKVSMTDAYKELYNKLKGHPYGGFFASLSPCILLKDPSTINRLFTSEAHHFNDHGLPVDDDLNLFEASLFFMSGTKWKALRRKLSPTFTSGKLKLMFSLMKDCSDELIKHLEDEIGNDVETYYLISRFTTDVIASCAFGLQPESIRNPKSEFRRMGEKFFTPGAGIIFLNALRFTMPSVFKKLKIPVEQGDVSRFFKGLISETISHRERTGQTRNDFVQLLIQLKQKGFVEHDPVDNDEIEDVNKSDEDFKLEMTDHLLAAQAFVFFVAGFETTASSLSFTLYLLAKHPDIRQKAREEVRRLKKEMNGITYEAVKSMLFLEACFDEAIRLYPPVPVLPRKCIKEFKMDDGYVMKAGTPIHLPIAAIHRDPEFFPSPDEFRPERFLGEAKKEIQPGSYIPFGHGPRICIARRFALLESILCLAMILDNFEFTTSDRMVGDLKVASKTFVVSPVGGIWLRFTPLN